MVRRIVFSLVCIIVWGQSAWAAEGLSYLPPRDDADAADAQGSAHASGCTTTCRYPCSPWCDRTGCYFEPELLFLKYHRQDGVRIGSDPGESEAFSFFATPRLSVGYRRGDGLGTRVRWFQFDQFRGIEDSADGDGVGVEARNIDLEVFDNFQLGACWSAEVSGGIRYCEFEETIVDVDDAIARQVDFNAFGLLLGVELSRQIAPSHALFGRMRASVLPGDKEVASRLPTPEEARFEDVIQGIVELSLGYEYNQLLPSGILLFARGGYEMQDWLGFSVRFDDAAGAPLASGHTDTGFSGFFFTLGMTR